jgi:hypothetical protein
MKRRTFAAALCAAVMMPLRALLPRREPTIDWTRYQLTFEPLSIPAADAAIIEQCRFSREDVARAFAVPVELLGDGKWDA